MTEYDSGQMASVKYLLSDDFDANDETKVFRAMKMNLDDMTSVALATADTPETKTKIFTQYTEALTNLYSQATKTAQSGETRVYDNGEHGNETPIYDPSEHTAALGEQGSGTRVYFEDIGTNVYHEDEADNMDAAEDDILDKKTRIETEVYGLLEQTALDDFKYDADNAEDAENSAEQAFLDDYAGAEADHGLVEEDTELGDAVSRDYDALAPVEAEGA